MTVGPLRSFGFQIAVAMTVLIVGVGAVIAFQVDRFLHAHERAQYTERLLLARAQFHQGIATDLELSVTGARVLAAQEAMRDAVLTNDAVAVLSIASEYSERVGTPLRGTPGMQVYDATGRLIVRAHQPLRGSQAHTPPAVREVLDSGEALGVILEDEILGLSLAGIAPVLAPDGTVIGAIEALTGLDAGFIAAQEDLLGVELVVTAIETLPPAFADQTAAVARRFMLNDQEHLTVALPLSGFQDQSVAALYFSVPMSEVNAGIQGVRLRALQATALGGLLAIGAALLFAYLFARPLRHLAGAARRLQANDLDTSIVASGPREVVELGHALDDLRASLAQTREAMLSDRRELASRFDASTASVRETSQEIAVMHGILAALSGDTPGGLTAVTDALPELEWVDGALIALATESGELSVAASSALRPEAARTLLVALARGIPGERLDAGITVADTRADTATAHLAPYEVGGFAMQPMLDPAGVTGLVAVTARAQLHITPARTELLRTVAREVAATLERTELASEVEENRRIAEAVLREMSDGLLVVGPDDICHVANPAAARLLDRPRQHLVGHLLEECLPLGRDALATLRRRATDGNGAPVLTQVAGRMLSITASPFVDVGPETAGIMVLIRDLSPEAEAERVKQDFVSMVGHELRTPLTLIRTTIDLLHGEDAGGLNDTQRRIIEVLHTNTDRLMALINDLLDMSAIDSGRMQILPENVDLADVVREAVQEAYPAVEAKQHQLLVHVPDTLPVWADRTRVRQVFVNLIGNAVKYTPAGGTIEVAATAVDSVARVDVRDDGIGISAEDQAHLFEKFYRTHQGRRTTGGTGLGLAIARSLVELHGGRIWCESDGHSGSTFSFTLPSRRI